MFGRKQGAKSCASRETKVVNCSRSKVEAGSEVSGCHRPSGSSKKIK